MDRDNFFDAKQAVAYGLVDAVLEHKPRLLSSNGNGITNGHHRNGNGAKP